MFEQPQDRDEGRPARYELPGPTPAIDVTQGPGLLTEYGNVDQRPTLTPPGPAQPKAESPRPRFIAGYEILYKIGHGGMGVVYKARHIALNRFVALKLHVLGGDAALAHLSRFRTEAEILARLKHENIVEIYDAGIHEGMPYLAMELIEGGSLAQALTDDPPSATQAARCLFKMVCAVHAAHERGIIHRDLKPGNVLLALPADGAADRLQHPKVTDFGIAKLLDTSPGLTLTGAVVGTPAYMAPEQAAGRNKDVGPAADIYALGAIFYEMLTGQRPFVGATSLIVLQKVQTLEPTPPSRLQRHVPKDLSVICMKCLEKAPTRRYASAADLADDLDRFLRHLPIRARRTSGGERLVRWCWRNPAPAIILGLVTVMLITAVGAAARFRNLAGERESARVQAVQAAERSRWQTYRSTLIAAGSALQAHRPEAAKAALVTAPEEFRGWEYRHFASQLDMASVVLPQGGPAGALAFSGDGQTLCAQAWASTLRIWDTATGEKRNVFNMPGEHFTKLALSPDASRLVASTDAGRVCLWNLASAKATATEIPARAGLQWSLIYSTDGQYIIAYEPYATDLYILDGTSGRVRTKLALPKPPVAVASAGQRLLVAHDESLLRIFAIPSGKELASRTAMRPSRDLAFVLSPDGKRLAYGANHPDSAVYLWDLEACRCIARMPGHQNVVWAVAFSPDGRRIASASADETVRLWDGVTGAFIATLTGHARPVMAVAFSPDSRYLASASVDQTVHLWDGRTGESLLALRGHEDEIGTLAYNRNGVLASAAADGTVRLWDPERALRLNSLRGHRSYVYDVAVHPDGRHIASSAWDGTVRLWDLERGTQTGCFQHAAEIVSGVAISPRGERLVATVRSTAPHSGGCVWDIASGRQIGRLRAPAGNTAVDTAYVYSPNGDVLAGGGCDGAVRLWSATTFEFLGTLSPPQPQGREIGYLAFRADGLELAAGRADGTISLWNIPERRLVTELHAHRGIVHRVAYNHDGSLLASAGEDHTVRLWDVASKDWLATLQQGCPVYGVAFHPDGSRLAAGCADNAIRLWDLVRNEEVAELRGHTSYVHAVAFSRDGTRLVSASGDYTLRVWDTLSPRERTKNARAKPGACPAPAREERTAAVLFDR
jgi:WD40 repeat protein